MKVHFVEFLDIVYKLIQFVRIELPLLLLQYLLIEWLLFDLLDHFRMV